MTPEQRRVLGGYSTAFRGMEGVLQSHADKVSPHVVDESVVLLFEQRVSALSREFPSLSLPFDKKSFFAHDVGRGAYYKLPGVQMALAFVIGQVEAALGDEPAAAGDPPPPKTDSVTGLLTRETLDEVLLELLDQATDPTRPVGVVMMDIDKFKSVNDTHGHPKGDAVLRSVAQLVRATVEGKGDAYRYGGEEFMLVLPNHDLEEATAVAERIRKALESRDTEGLRVTASFGVSVFPAQGTTAAEIISRADRALYDAKNRGRNLVRIFGEPDRPDPEMRTPIKKVPQPGGLTDTEAGSIRQQYFTTRSARCPKDDALLDVRVERTMGATVQKLWVSCGLCGLSAQI